MAKLQDLSDIHRLISDARRAQVERVTLEQLDHGRLCPGCMLPLSEQPGEPSKHFGELFCGPCVRAFRHGEATRA